MSGPVLIVDDSLTVRMDLKEALEAAGLPTLSCANASEAREVLARQPVSLVILDASLSDPDGCALLSELRARPVDEQTPRLILAPATHVPPCIGPTDAGAEEYVGKPYDVSYVVTRARERTAPTSTSSPRPAERRALLIGAARPHGDALRRGLEASGYRVSVAHSGADGLRQAATERPCVIVVDPVLPDLEGAAVIRSLRLDETLRSTRCLLLTDSEGGDAERTALDAGADAYARTQEESAVVLARLTAVVRADASPRPAARPRPPQRILVVDDSPTYLHELAQVLRDEGYEVELARSGEEALGVLAVRPIDCVLLDRVMPGLGGDETCRRVKQSPGLRDIPLILLTACDEREAMLRGLETGADDYIAKSSDFDVLKARVRAQLRRKQFEDENRRIRQELMESELEAARSRSAHALAVARSSLVEQLERKNSELEAFSYSVSHDLRSPLRSIDGFSQALLEDCGESLDELGMDHLRRIRNAAQRMGELIDDLLHLSRVGLAELDPVPVDLTAIARSVAADLRVKHPERRAEWIIQEDLAAEADPRLMRVLLENLLGNALKFTARQPQARIEVGLEDPESRTYFVRDNGEGFDMAHADKLFTPFQRLHSDADFPGTGIGLATVYRIVDRHGGKVRASSAPSCGTTVSFTLPRQYGWTDA